MRHSLPTMAMLDHMMRIAPRDRLRPPRTRLLGMH